MTMAKHLIQKGTNMALKPIKTASLTRRTFRVDLGDWAKWHLAAAQKKTTISALIRSVMNQHVSRFERNRSR
jgi:hypothetical protein